MWKTKKRWYTITDLSLSDWCGFFISAAVVITMTSYLLMTAFGPSSLKLQSAPQEALAFVAVAVANNVWTDTSRIAEIPILSPQDVIVAGNAVVKDGMNNEIFFTDIFQQLTEYEEVAGLDINTYLDGKTEKNKALNVYIDSLKNHTDNAKKTYQVIQSQTELHRNALKNVQGEIKNLQINIEWSFRERNSSGIMNGISDLDELALIQQDHLYGQLFGQQIMREYQSVIKYSDKKLELIQANISALTQGVTVRLPAWNSIKDLEQLQIFSSQKI